MNNMKTDWNKEGFFSGVTEDYSNYKWYKGEKENPYQVDDEQPLAASFWIYERDFHFDFLDTGATDATDNETLSGAYKRWKTGLLKEHLPGKSPNPNGDTTDWEKVFETGKRGD
jgi:hypothetical protein